MLIEPKIDELEKLTESRFDLAILAAKRARDINDRGEKEESNIISQAAKEIAAGKIRLKIKEKGI